MTDKKSGEIIHSNWKCLYASLNRDDEDIDIESLIQDPKAKQIESNWLKIRTNYENYILDTG